MARGKLDRIQLAILMVSVVAALALGAWKGPLWGTGGFAGGLVGYWNFRWLRRTVERLLGQEKGKGRVAFVYSFKLVIVAAVLAGLVWVAGVPAVAILVGLGAMPIGIFAEMIWSLAVLPPEPEA